MCNLLFTIRGNLLRSLRNPRNPRVRAATSTLQLRSERILHYCCFYLLHPPILNVKGLQTCEMATQRFIWFCQYSNSKQSAVMAQFFSLVFLPMLCGCFHRTFQGNFIAQVIKAPVKKYKANSRTAGSTGYFALH